MKTQDQSALSVIEASKLTDEEDESHASIIEDHLLELQRRLDDLEMGYQNLASIVKELHTIAKTNSSILVSVSAKLDRVELALSKLDD